MELQEVVRRRRMVRRYSPEPVDAGAVDRMLRNAVRAPSAGFTQGWSFLVLDAPEDVARFWAATSPAEAGDPPSAWLAGMRTAPVVVVVLASKDAYLDRYAQDDKGWADRAEERWSAPYWHVDAGMAALLMLQTAVDEGLGACFFGVPPARVGAFRAAFGVPEAWSPTGAVTVGHPAPGEAPRGSVTRRARRPLAEVVHRGRWGS
ncbi:nitroreductase family protein [Cellulomonas sp. PhB143]|uniref:nitroreductase family protein n=1 Tax=Cellulomonas sp. PhB143 TaxID=2485186 RepID=UPI000F4974D1|nr:nitroreductase family protein [Cellulomonas sp. PhB143]ROS78845.1 nitroreductase [Cellulomonas sp. PhB143]